MTSNHKLKLLLILLQVKQEKYAFGKSFYLNRHFSLFLMHYVTKLITFLLRVKLEGIFRILLNTFELLKDTVFPRLCVPLIELFG